MPAMIRLRVGHPWMKEGGAPVAAAQDGRWQSIRSQIEPVEKWFRTTTSRRERSAVPFHLSIARLRGSHGQMLLANVIERIRAADILLMDIGSTDERDFNPNVLLETGMALASRGAASRYTFILTPAGVHLPSDLNGFLVTEYEAGEGGAITLVDPLGFQAALRGAVMTLALERDMIGAVKQFTVEDEGEDRPDTPAKGKKATATKRARRSRAAREG